MKNRYYSALASLVVVSGLALAAQPSFAQTAPTGSPAETNVGGVEPTNIPGHGRVDEVDQRDNNQQNRINAGEADGQLSKGQAARDQPHLDHQEATQAKQEDAHGGHLTKGDLHRDNKSQNRSSRKIHRQRHARRAK